MLYIVIKRFYTFPKFLIAILISFNEKTALIIIFTCLNICCRNIKICRGDFVQERLFFISTLSNKWCKNPIFCN